ncbi:MAG: hypothetical protein AAGK02_13000 [Pseudomonadota bacterium]
MTTSNLPVALLVDDAPVTRFLLEELFVDQIAHVHVATSMAEAEMTIRGVEPDLIIVNLASKQIAQSFNPERLRSDLSDYFKIMIALHDARQTPQPMLLPEGCFDYVLPPLLEFRTLMDIVKSLEDKL